MAREVSEVISHWAHLIENLDLAPSDFYEEVEGGIEAREIPEANLSLISYREGGPFSPYRRYLRAQRREFVLDICGAPFGRGFFVSWWLGEVRSPFGLLALVGLALLYLFTYGALLNAVGRIPALVAAGVLLPVFVWAFARFLSDRLGEIDAALAAMPLIGPYYRRWFSPLTYYRIDTALMFRDAVHNAVLDVVDGLIDARGLRALTETERKPVLKSFFGE